MAPSIHTIRITLRDSNPPIWRRVAMPSNATLGYLHQVIQIAMGWTDSHLHQFILEDKSRGIPDPKALAKLLREGRHEEWLAAQRSTRVFAPKVAPFGDSLEMDGEDEAGVALADVCPKVKDRLMYEYDFGDSWEHTIEVQKIEPPRRGVKYPICLAGKRACPPEDCGGIWGYYRLLDVVNDPDHEEHADLSEWLGEGFDPDEFNIDEANQQLAKMR